MLTKGQLILAFEGRPFELLRDDDSNWRIILYSEKQKYRFIECAFAQELNIHEFVEQYAGPMMRMLDGADNSARQKRMLDAIKAEPEQLSPFCHACTPCSAARVGEVV